MEVQNTQVNSRNMIIQYFSSFKYGFLMYVFFSKSNHGNTIVSRLFFTRIIYKVLQALGLVVLAMIKTMGLPDYLNLW